jgi:uncharacterized membrane protein
MLAEAEPFDEASFLDTIKSMIRDGSLRLSPPSYEIYSVLDYLLAPTVSGWFWLILWLTGISTLAVYAVPNLFPLSVLRWVFGSFLLCLPGYTTIKLLFPYSELRFYERLALSLVLSLAIIPILGFILNFTPWGIRFIPILVTLGAYTILAASVAASRIYLAIVQRPDWR